MLGSNKLLVLGGSCDCTCGEAQRATRIVGGVETEVSEYPWQAGLVSKGSSSVFCGGSLVNSKWVLTAAHCTASANPNQIQVRRKEKEGRQSTYNDDISGFAGRTQLQHCCGNRHAEDECGEDQEPPGLQ